MPDLFPPAKQRPALLSFAESAAIPIRTIRKDECGDWRIPGKQGYVYAVLDGYQLCFIPRPYTPDYLRAKRHLTFCCLVQNGIFFLDRLPASQEAETIREIFGIPKRVKYSEETLARKREAALMARAKSPIGNRIHRQKASSQRVPSLVDEFGAPV